MIVEMKMPSPGESITEVEMAEWVVQEGDYVEQDQIIAMIDSDKATLELTAEQAGAISLLVEDGDTITVGDVVAKIDTEAKAPEKAPEAAAPAAANGQEKAPAPTPEPEAAPAPVAVPDDVKATPLAEEIIRQNGVDATKIQGSGANGRIVKADVEAYLAGGIDHSELLAGWGHERAQERKKMSSLRRKVAERLVSVKNETAMLTTFNEVDMSPIMNLRKKYKEQFKEKYGVSLGFMGFFTKAVCEALRLYPAVNSMIDGDEMITYDYADVGIAVSTPKGLMVPIVRDAQLKGLHEIEGEIKRLAIKARDGKITLQDMQGGTFTITNGGVFGSMLSTPIINPPQSAILGMHNIVERPVAVNGKVEVRPVMYVALSYDHRIIDGKESVSFLYKVKEMLEDPVRLMYGGKPAEEVLLGL